MNRRELETKAVAVADKLLQSKGYISMVDVLMAMGKLTKENHDRWRSRKVAYLERVMPGSLNQFQFLLRVIRTHARDRLRLKPSRTVYTSWGKGRREPVRFSKFGDPYLEEMYSTHYVSSKLTNASPKGRGGQPEPAPAPKPTLPEPRPDL
jgi:hypothetical protein